MRPKMLPVLVLAWLAAGAVAQEPSGAGLRIVEVVADPQTDWSSDGKVTGSDEFVEIANHANQTIDLRGYVLELEDTTPEAAALAGRLAPGARLVVLNPPGSLNNDATLRLRDAAGRVVDSVSYGSFSLNATVPSANAQGDLDEALALTVDGWRLRHATPGRPNDEPWLTVTHDLDVVDGRWLMPPNATRSVHVRVLDADRPIVSVAWDDQAAAPDPAVHRKAEILNVTGTPGPDRPLSVNVTFADGSTWLQQLADLRVDDAGPLAPILMVPATANASAVPVTWLPSLDDGIGTRGYEVQWTDAATNTTINATVLTHSATLTNLSHVQAVHVRVRGVDAYGNAGPWSAVGRMDVDLVAPSPVAAVRVSGSDATVVAWDAASDDGLGVTGYEVRRVWGDRVDVFVVGNRMSWTDPDAPRQGQLEYAVRAHDGAGNASPWTSVTADHDALRPVVRGVRVLKPLWSSGVQELRVDFDRPMNVSVAPGVYLGGDVVRGSWMANASTYWVKWAAPSEASEGVNQVTVLTATARDGRGLGRPAVKEFRVDTQPPVTRWDPSTRTLTAWDAQDPAPRTYYKVWRNDEASPLAYLEYAVQPHVLKALDPGTWQLRFFSTDAAGNRESSNATQVVVAAEPVAAPPADQPVPSAPSVSTPDGRPAQAAPAADASRIEANRQNLEEERSSAGWWFAVAALSVVGATVGLVVARRKRLVAAWVRLRSRGAGQAEPSLGDRLRVLRDAEPQPGEAERS